MRLFDDVGSLIPDPLLRRAFVLAEKGRGGTSPNPIVGCLIAQDDEVVGEGFHARAGGPHAEAVALAEAGPRASGATAYVTLEPCNHFGATPPCSEALVTRGVARVVIGMHDPNPLAVGGAVRLREAGLEVDFAPDPSPFEIQNESWLHFVRTGQPFVQVKVAVSLDGHASLADGARSAISGSGGTELTMRLRSAADAVLVGASTARIDDPALTVRDGDGAALPRQPLRAVLVGGSGQAPDVSLLRDGLGESVLLVPEGTALPAGVGSVEYDAEGGIRAAFAALAARGVVRVLVEAGPRLLSAILEDGIAQSYVFVHAGGFAGADAPALLAGAGRSGSEALRRDLEAVEAGVIGAEAVSVWRPVAGARY